jgi:hypothetical protein
MQMLFTNITYIGIDPTTGTTPFTYSAVDSDLRLLVLGQADMDEVLAFVAGQKAAFVAVCAPRRPNQGKMSEPKVRDALSPQPNPGRWTNFRIAEYLLRQANINIHQTCADKSECPNWMQMGFKLYSRLEKIGYKDYQSSNSEHQMIEVYPHASFTCLLGIIPFAKHSLEGRLQRQLILHEQGINLPDPMRFFEEITRHRLLCGILPDEELSTPSELDALSASLTAWMAVNKPGKSCLVGDAEEGQILLPTTSLQGKYNKQCHVSN